MLYECINMQEEGRSLLDAAPSNAHVVLKVCLTSQNATLWISAARGQMAVRHVSTLTGDHCVYRIVPGCK